VRSAKRSLAAAEASNGASASSVMTRPRTISHRVSGSRSQHGLVVGDQPSAAVDQAKGEIRFPAAGGPAERDGAAIDRNRGGMNEEAVGYDPAGSRMQNRAPATVPSAFLRFSAQIEPRCATTICCEIERPSPEWVPNFSPCGRSV
jgi:hypothetical protein